MASCSTNRLPLLTGGVRMPLFGLGTWLSENAGEAYEATKAAINSGVRLIDTASMYNNEEDIGKALKETNVPRDELCIVTKLHPDSHASPAAAKAALAASLEKLQLDVVDVYLMHSPSGKNVVEIYRALEELRVQGKCRAIGVSNFGQKQLEQLIEATGLVPAVNQIELHLWNQQPGLVQFCKDKGIVVMGFCPLARNKMIGKSPELLALATELKRTEHELALKWSVEEGIVTIPKSSNAERIKKNASVFDWTLTESQMEQLRKCNCAFKASSACNAQDLPWDDVR